jgi:hypothetical protein
MSTRRCSSSSSSSRGEPPAGGREPERFVPPRRREPASHGEPGGLTPTAKSAIRARVIGRLWAIESASGVTGPARRTRRLVPGARHPSISSRSPRNPARSLRSPARNRIRQTSRCPARQSRVPKRTRACPPGRAGRNQPTLVGDRWSLDGGGALNRYDRWAFRSHRRADRLRTRLRRGHHTRQRATDGVGGGGRTRIPGRLRRL